MARRVCFRHISLCVLAVSAMATGAYSADMTARQVTEELYKATDVAPLDYTRRDLAGLDLAGLKFKKAKLSEANLFGADLSGADLSGVDLHDAKLDRVTIIGTRFDHANLSGASILRPSSANSFEGNRSETASFTGADLTKARLFGVFTGGSFAKARMTGVTFAPSSDTGFIEVLWRSRLDSADMSGADLSGADLAHVSFRFANLQGANLAGASLVNADLSHADLSGADLTGADLSRADLDRTILTGAKGLDSVGGLSTAVNRDKAID